MQQEKIIEVIVWEINRQIEETGFALKWKTYTNTQAETRLLRSQYQKIFRIFIASGRLGYKYSRPTKQQRDRMDGSHVWTITREHC